MDEIIAAFLATKMSLVVGTDIFNDESAAEERNCILVHTMQAVSQFIGIEVFDVTVLVCDVVLDTARTRAATIRGLFDDQRGIFGSSWGTIGPVVSRYEGTDTMMRTVYSITFKTGKQED